MMSASRQSHLSRTLRRRMENEPNPYAPPVVPHGERRRSKKGQREQRYWREGDAVCLPVVNARLPKRCVVCNGPIAGDRVSRLFQWHPRWITLLILVGWIPYIIAAALTRKTARVEHGLCAEHTARRKNGLILLWGGLGAGLVVLIIGGSGHAVATMALGFVILLGGLIAGGIMSRTATPKKIDTTFIWLKVGQPFLDSCPERDD